MKLSGTLMTIGLAWGLLGTPVSASADCDFDGIYFHGFFQYYAGVESYGSTARDYCLRLWTDLDGKGPDDLKCREFVAACHRMQTVTITNGCDAEVCSRLTQHEDTLRAQQAKQFQGCPVEKIKNSPAATEAEAKVGYRKEGCLRGQVCVTDIFQNSRAGLFNFTGFTWPDLSTPEDYATTWLTFLEKYFFNEKTIKDTLNACPGKLDALGEVGKFAVELEPDVRDFFFEQICLGDYRVKKSGLGFKMTGCRFGGTSKYPLPQGLLNWKAIPDHLRGYYIDPDEFWPKGYGEKVQKQTLALWFKMYMNFLTGPSAANLTATNTKLVLDSFLKALDSSRDSTARAIARQFKAIRKLLPKDVAPSTEFAFFPALDDAEAMVEPSRDPALKAEIEFVKLGGSDRVYTHLTGMASQCTAKAMEPLLAALKAMERSATPGARFHRIRMATPELRDLDVVEAYRQVLQTLSGCAHPYSLIRMLYLEYEKSGVVVDQDLYLKLLQAGKDAYAQEISNR